VDSHCLAVLGRPLLVEVMRQRIERAKMLIVGGETSPKRLARACGFGNAHALSVQYQRHEGSSLKVFLERHGRRN